MEEPSVDNLVSSYAKWDMVKRTSWAKQKTIIAELKHRWAKDLIPCEFVTQAKAEVFKAVIRQAMGITKDWEATNAIVNVRNKNAKQLKLAKRREMIRGKVNKVYVRIIEEAFCLRVDGRDPDEEGYVDQSVANREGLTELIRASEAQERVRLELQEIFDKDVREEQAEAEEHRQLMASLGSKKRSSVSVAPCFKEIPTQRKGRVNKLDIAGFRSVSGKGSRITTTEVACLKRHLNAMNKILYRWNAEQDWFIEHIGVRVYFAQAKRHKLR